MKINESSIARGHAKLHELGHTNVSLADVEEALRAANKSGERYPHKLDADLLANLEQLSMLAGGAPNKLIAFRMTDRDGERTRNSRINELQYWGLAEPSGHKDGRWALTSKGHKFLYGGLMIPNKIYTVDGVATDVPKNACMVNYAAANVRVNALQPHRDLDIVHPDPGDLLVEQLATSGDSSAYPHRRRFGGCTPPYRTGVPRVKLQSSRKGAPVGAGNRIRQSADDGSAGHPGSSASGIRGHGPARSSGG